MKRSKKLLFLLLALVVLSSAAYAAAKLTPEETEEQAEDTSITVLALDSATVTSLSWTYGEERLSFSKTDDAWAYDEDAAFPLKDSRITSMLSALSEIKATMTIEAPEDLAQYGLEKPVSTVTVTADKTSVIHIGNESTLGGERYISLGDGNVYLVDAGLLDSFSYGLYDMVTMEAIPSMSSIDSFAVTAESQNYILYHLEKSGMAYSDYYEWFASKDGSDGYVTLDNELTEAVVESISSLSWQKCVDYNAADNLADYGLDNPVATVTVNYTVSVEAETNEKDENGNTVTATEEETRSFVLELGDYADEGSYARIAGSSMVYLIDDSICDELLLLDLDMLRPDEVLRIDRDTIISTTITLNGESYQITQGVKTATGSDGGETQETVYLLGETEVDLDGILDLVTGMESSGYAAGLTQEREAELSFIFQRASGSFSSLELSFHPYDSESCYVTIYGEPTVFVSREDLQILIETIEAAVL